MTKIANVKMSNSNANELGYRDLVDMLADGWVDTWKLNVERLKTQDRIRVWNVGQKQILDVSIKQVIDHPKDPKIILGEDANIINMEVPWIAGPQRRKYTEE
ncbi:hypothetical protein GNP84_13330 [Aliivibrio fischeri]|uniref:hypothetical protein n=1 Tax=Aliivibrio fischeri TaxID=668 RepID=UPI0012D88897|nr:hypothetical protein [Aliivibrio fischeri]MUK77863.1 hypothetical protein [Aliivibrio fischeri]